MKAAYYIIGALLIWIIFRECSRPSEPLPPSIQARQDTIRRDDGLIKSYQDSLNYFKAERVSMALKSKSREKAFKIETGRLQGELTKARGKASAEILADPVVQIQDTIINKQAARITDLENERDSAAANFTASLKVMELKFDAQKDIATQLTAINQTLFTAWNKEKRKGKVAKVLIPVALVLGFVIGEQL